MILSHHLSPAITPLKATNDLFGMNETENIKLQKHCIDLEHTSTAFKAADYVQMYNRALKIFDKVTIERMPREFVTLNPDASKADRAMTWVRIMLRHRSRSFVTITSEQFKPDVNKPWYLLIDTAIHECITATLSA